MPFDFALPGVSSVSKASVEEIREWWNMSDQEREKVMGALDQRLLDNTTF